MPGVYFKAIAGLALSLPSIISIILISIILTATFLSSAPAAQSMASALGLPSQQDPPAQNQNGVNGVNGRGTEGAQGGGESVVKANTERGGAGQEEKKEGPKLDQDAKLALRLGARAGE